MDAFNYVLQGREPVIEPDFDKWAAFMSSDARVVAKTTVGDILISTVFLGINHDYWGGPPLLFETMIFGGHEGVDEDQQRCSTWEQAEAKHAAAVQKARAALS